MEKVTVIFKGENREIVTNFELNTETGDLNYQVQVTPPFEDENAIANGGLEIYLANIFLGSLQMPAELNNGEDTPETSDVDETSNEN